MAPYKCILLLLLLSWSLTHVVDPEMYYRPEKSRSRFRYEATSVHIKLYSKK